jgi:hypothetical protein
VNNLFWPKAKVERKIGDDSDEEEKPKKTNPKKPKLV